MFKKKTMATGAIIVAFAAGSLGLTACSSDATVSEGASDKTTVNWWSWDPDNSNYQAWVDAFEAENPDIDLKFRFIQYSDYENAVRLAAKSDSGPDVFGIEPGAMSEQFAPLTLDLTTLAEEEIGADWQDQLLGTDQLAVEGKQVSLPWKLGGGGLIWYNKNILDAAGATPPTNLAEWKDMCAKVEAQGVTCFVHGAKDDWVNLDVFQAIANQIDPGAIYAAFDGEKKFNTPDMVSAFDAWKGLFDEGIIQPGALGMTQYPDANDAMSKGEAASIAFGTWHNDHMTKARLAGSVETYGPDIVNQVFLPIAFPDVVGGAQETGRLFGAPAGWAISSKSKQQEAAFTFVKWFTTSETAQSMIASALNQPALASMPVTSDDLVAPELQQPALDEQAKQFANLIGPRQISNADVASALGQALSAVASDQMSSKDAAASVQAAIDGAK
ncbi:ABC transporter substrate-binding protein [Microterricola viridarii]|uniref:Carbohydrate ABC transporter substrate-binding protein, CUT1 family n=1 Tax=Microterricola viridarii TaxID=412690 RepID=A0A109QXN1_9MICO|nr:ABC transporter substrate-binding protein [Microterricola viridarii]AMB60210.1 hypothetical protein AWU67_16605 [Microterricola viridarii]